GVAEQRVTPFDRPGNGLGVRVEQQLGRVKAVTLLRCVGSVHAIAVALAGAHFRQVDVPDLGGLLRQANPPSFLGTIGPVEETQLYAGGVLRKEREIDTGAIPGGALGIRLPWPNSHTSLLARRGGMRVYAFYTSGLCLIFVPALCPETPGRT